MPSILIGVLLLQQVVRIPSVPVRTGVAYFPQGLPDLISEDGSKVNYLIVQEARGSPLDLISSDWNVLIKSWSLSEEQAMQFRFRAIKTIEESPEILIAIELITNCLGWRRKN